eukprot:NODE_1425_length_1535_cov_24.451548_g1286_i0.p1 GENE.NODE_1425_length_1535_cov_24.451548_g1286_i0~~NODE_1425_length_1535_cov_24.451548_g1286_i0.p1  ORF type:complete len:344 (+),score=51.76 NODE_1425_length_1535_cov_24.451548_g1286_i0:189-1220(+)
MASKAVLSASNAGAFKDNTPHLTPAGKVLTDLSDNVGTCLTQDMRGRPATPPSLAPFRKSCQQAPGVMMKHFSSHYDPSPPDIRFGRANDFSQSAQALMQGKSESVFLERYRELKESAHTGQRKDTLGKPLCRNPLPPITADPSFKFGAKSVSSVSAKELMYPLMDPHDEFDAATRLLYVKTHHSYGAGEQKLRGYDWAAHAINPVTFRFGAVDNKREQDGAAQSIRPDLTKQNKTVIVRKEVEDWKDLESNSLGAARKGPSVLAEGQTDRVFGRPSRTDEWDAKKCMAGCNEPDAVDKDLGKATRVGYRNQVDDRVYGHAHRAHRRPSTSGPASDGLPQLWG